MMIPLLPPRRYKTHVKGPVRIHSAYKIDLLEYIVLFENPYIFVLLYSESDYHSFYCTIIWLSDIEDVTFKTGNFKKFSVFSDMLESALAKVC